MRKPHVLYALVVSAITLLPPVAMAQGRFASPPTAGWTGYVDPRTGTAVDFPAEIFSVPAGETKRGIGTRFRTPDGRAELTIYALQNDSNDAPRSYLAKNLIIDRSNIEYQRVTNRFFAISGVRQGRVFYSRCNFAARLHCIYLEYPERETRAWDGIVTSISHSLRGVGRF